MKRYSSALLLTAWTALLPSSALAGREPPKEMTRIEYVFKSPFIPPGSFAAAPKTLFRAGDLYLASEEKPDYQSGIHGLVVVAAPESWMVNLFTRSARHLVEKGPGQNVHVPIFPQEKKGAALERLEIGKEAEFFAQSGGKKTPGEDVRGKRTSRSEIQVEGNKLLLIADAQTGKPIVLERQQGQNIERIEYLAYETVPFDPKRFRVPDGITVEESVKPVKGLKNSANAWIGEFITHYYEHPEPKRIAALLKALGEEQQAERSWSLVGFIAPVMAANPTILDESIAAGKDGGATLRHFVALSLRQCGSGACLEALKKNPYGFEPAGLAQFASYAPPKPDNVPLNAPDTLDFLWADFLATGETRGVERIAKLVADKWPDAEAKKLATQDLLVVGAAHWSLVSNAKQHAKVRKVVETESSRSPQLKAVLAEIDAPAKVASAGARPASR